MLGRCPLCSGWGHDDQELRPTGETYSETSCPEKQVLSVSENFNRTQARGRAGTKDRPSHTGQRGGGQGGGGAEGRRGGEEWQGQQKPGGAALRLNVRGWAGGRF